MGFRFCEHIAHKKFKPELLANKIIFIFDYIILFDL